MPDHEQVVTAVSGLQLARGSGTGPALTTALNAVLRGTPPASNTTQAQIVLLSDGDNGAPVADALAALNAAHVPVSTIAYGTAGGDPAALAQIASATGGTTYTAQTAAQLRSAYDGIGGQVVADQGRSDIADLFAGIAVLLMLGTAVPSLAWFSRLA